MDAITGNKQLRKVVGELQGADNSGEENHVGSLNSGWTLTLVHQQLSAPPLSPPSPPPPPLSPLSPVPVMHQQLSAERHSGVVVNAARAKGHVAQDVGMLHTCRRNHSTALSTHRSRTLAEASCESMWQSQPHAPVPSVIYHGAQCMRCGMGVLCPHTP